MAAPTAANVLVGKPLATGGILVAPPGTALPTTATAAPNVSFVATGYAGEGGVTQTIGADTQDVVAWGGDTVRTIQTSHSVTYKFEFIETNAAVLALVYGDANVTSVAAGSGHGNTIAVLLNSATLPHKEYVLEVKDGDRKVRVVIPDGQITERGDVVYVHSDAVKYEVTVTCYPDASGNKAYLYSDDGAVGA